MLSEYSVTYFAPVISASKVKTNSTVVPKGNEILDQSIASSPAPTVALVLNRKFNALIRTLPSVVDPSSLTINTSSSIVTPKAALMLADLGSVDITASETTP